MVAGTVLHRFSLLLVSQGVAATGQLLASILVARSLGPTDFGRWSYALAYTAIFASIVDFGMSFTTLRDLSRSQEDNRRYLGNVMAIRACLSVCALALIIALQPLFGGGPGLFLIVLLVGGQTILASFTQLMTTALYARGSLALSAAIRGGQGLLLAGIVWTLVTLRPGLVPFAAAYASIGLATVVIAGAVVVAQFGRAFPRFDLDFWRPYLRRLSPLALAVALTSVYYFADTIMLSFAGLDRDVGWYNAAYRPIFALLLLVGALGQAFLPDEARSLNAGTLRSAEPMVRHYRSAWMLALPIVLLGPLAAPDIIRILYGAAYEGSVVPLQILLIAGGLMFFSSFFSGLVLLEHRHRTYLAGVALGAGLNVLLNAALIPPFTLVGAATATVASEAAVMLWMRSKCGYLPSEARNVCWGVALPGLAAAGGGALLVLSGVPSLVAAGAAALAFAAFLLKTGQVRFALSLPKETALAPAVPPSERPAA